MDELNEADPDRFEGAQTGNFYELLGVPPTASREDLRVAYRRLALLHHPDRHAEAERASAERVFRRIAAAYAMLSDPAKRQRYDAALARGIALEPEHVDQTISLREVLAALQTQEHVFAGESLDRLSKPLATFVRENLIGDLHEQVVETIPIRQPPSGAVYEGSFQSGALVMTTLRLLFPYTTQRQTIRGNVRTTHTYNYMQSVALPAITEMRITSTSRRILNASLCVVLGENSITTPMKTRNITKLLLLCRYWGIPAIAEEQPNKTRDRWWLLWWAPLLWGGGAGAGGWLLSIDPAQLGVLVWAMAAGVGYYRYRTLYALPAVAEWLRATSASDGGQVPAVTAT